MGDDAFNETLHDELLTAITSGKMKKKTGKKTTEDVGAGELLNAIKSTKNVKESRDSISSKKTKKAKKTSSTAHKTLEAPLHRSEVEKIQRRIGFDELEKDLKVWEPVVSEHVHANNHQFPLNRETFNIQTAATRNEGFVARTPLEKAMDAVLATSKCNLANNHEYTQEEMEIIKAMNVAEAKEKLSKLRRLRALQSYQEAKFRRQGKIKSKNYHRIMKRAKRREELKELDELLVRDPEAARAKLEELDKDRIYERATLKHRSQNKMSKVIARHASKDPNAKKLMDDHIRFGKEMKEKIGIESDEEKEDDESEDGREAGEFIEDVLNDVEKAEMDEESAREKLKKMRKEKEKKLKEEKARGEGKKIELVELVPFDEEPIEEKTTKDKKKGLKRKTEKDGDTNMKKAKAEESVMENVVDLDVEGVFDEVEDKVNREGGEKIMAKKTKNTTKSTTKEKRMDPVKKSNDDADLLLDPNNYLVSETSKVMQVGPDMDDGNDLIEDNVAKMGEAFVDDDVMAEFVDEKEELEEAEKEKDMDLTLLGWGSWTGPGMSNKKKKKFVIKAQDKERKDKGKLGLIISEKRDVSMDSLQPKTVPYPFTRMEDFEASLSQPLGKEWNSLSSHSSLIKPSVSTQGGRVILPMSKNDVLKTRLDTQEK